MRKIHYNPPEISAYVVPAGYYLAKCVGYREPKKRICPCPIEDQVAVDFELTDPRADIDREYRAQVILCTNPQCQHRRHNISKFLSTWLQDKVEELQDENGDIILESLVKQKADMEIGNFQGENYPHPYSRVNRVLPPGSLINFS